MVLMELDLTHPLVPMVSTGRMAQIAQTEGTDQTAPTEGMDLMVQTVQTDTVLMALMDMDLMVQKVQMDTTALDLETEGTAEEMERIHLMGAETSSLPKKWIIFLAKWFFILRKSGQMSALLQAKKANFLSVINF